MDVIKNGTAKFRTGTAKEKSLRKVFIKIIDTQSYSFGEYQLRTSELLISFVKRCLYSELKSTF